MDFETEEECEFLNQLGIHFLITRSDSEHARALEEQWIDSLASPSGASLASSPSASATSSILQGLVAGFFFPLIPFFFMRKVLHFYQSYFLSISIIHRRGRPRFGRMAAIYKKEA